MLGVDGTPSGWAFVTLGRGGVRDGGEVGNLAELAVRFPAAKVIAVDIPLGFPEAGPRRADAAARARLGPRKSSVFPVPPRAALEAEDYGRANALCRSLTGKGLSKQSYNLRDKVLEANALWATERRLHEVHPEMSFLALNGGPVPHYKKSWNGLELRRRLLLAAGIEIPPGLDFGKAGADDVLDAAAVAWSARRIARGKGEHVPEDAADGEPVIWF